MKKRSIIPFLKASAHHYTSHRASRMGAALSYYTIFSIIPLFSLIILVVGSVLGHDYIRSALGGEISQLVGSSGAAFLDTLSDQASSAPAGITTLISVIVLVVGTLGVLYELKNAMDDLWNVTLPKSKSGIKYAIFSRILSLSLIPVLVFLLLVSLVFSSLLNAFGTVISSNIGITILFKILNTVFSYIVVSFLFAFIYKYLPHKKLPWKEVLGGALITALLFMFGKALIGVYIGRIASTSVFGAAGALVIILLWIYYSVQIFFFGASLTYVYSERYGYVKDHVSMQ